MTRYRNDPGAVRALVRADSVHRDVYVDRELFDLEMERLWHSAWVYVGHDSQVPAVGRLLHDGHRPRARHHDSRADGDVRRSPTAAPTGARSSSAPAR